MESLAPLLIVVFSFVKKKGLISFLFFHFISFFANMLSFYARAHKLFILSSFFCFGFYKSLSFLNFVLQVMDCGSLLIFFAPSILLFIFFPLIFFSFFLLSSYYFPSLTPSKCPTLHLLHLVATCFVTCCSSFSLLSNLLLLPTSIITCYHCLSSSQPSHVIA